MQTGDAIEVQNGDAIEVQVEFEDVDKEKDVIWRWEKDDLQPTEEPEFPQLISRVVAETPLEYFLQLFTEENLDIVMIKTYK